jgi:nucleotide-binding universal stress UspA family protein
MHRNQRTLVALSGTIADRSLVKYAGLLASMGFARSYEFVHVASSESDTHTPQYDHQTEEYVASLVSELFQPGRPELTVTTAVHHGVPIDTLLEVISAKQCDLVLLGQNDGRTGQRRTARRLALVAPCSVLLLPLSAPVTIHTVLAPVDFSKNSTDSAEVAISIAHAAQHAACRLAHVYSDTSTVRYPETVEENLRLQNEAFNRFAATLNTRGMLVEQLLIEGNDIAGSILHLAERHAADLLVVSTRGRSSAASVLLGSVTSELLIRSPIAVLAVKHFGAMMGLYDVLKEHRFLSGENLHTN